MPYSGPDIGGFTGAPSPELFVRWFQIASYLPFFRTHCAFYLPAREPWEFGDEVLAILRHYLEQRYRLLPYWYTLAWHSSQSGHPLVRPLFWNDAQDQALWAVDDAFLVGDALLVAPVVTQGQTKRSVTLPRGGWYSLAEDFFYHGGASLDLDAPLAHLPVLVRAGSILPTVEENDLVLHLYRPLDGESGSGCLYTDAGDGYGAHRLDRFTLEPVEGGEYIFSWRSEGDFTLPYRLVSVRLHGFGTSPVRIAGREGTVQDGGVVTEPPAQVVIHE
jgi:alpha-glucosidase